MIQADLTFKQGDTEEPVATTLTENGAGVNLQNAEAVTFIMDGYASDTTVSGSAQVVTAEDGRVAYHWDDGDTDVPGLYFVEWVVTWPGGNEQRFPNDGFDYIQIEGSL